MDVAPQFTGYSGVEIVVDDETTYFSGSTAGRVMTSYNPWGTQAMADRMLQRLQGYQYQPFTATDALLDPAAELGDGVVLNGLYAGLFSIDRRYSPLMATDIAAPQDEEIDHEYPFEPRTDREITRKFMAVQSEFVLQSNQIAAKVSQTGGDSASFGWQLLSDHFSLFSGSAEVFRVDDTGATVKGIITATGGQIGKFNIGDAIWNNIPSFSNPGGLTSGVYLGTDGIRLGQNFTVDPAGNATARRLTVDTLVIGGSNVSAATLNSRANHAYSSTSSGGYCYTGASYGNNYNRATQPNAGQYPAYFTAGSITAKTSIFAPHVEGATLVGGNVTFAGRRAGWRTIVINGTSYNVMVGA